MLRAAALALFVLIAFSGASLSQEVPQPVSPILTIDQERLFRESLFGQRVQADIDARTSALAAENRQLEAELGAEEQDLTDRRPTLPAAEFRALADAFDQKVQRFRIEQDGKEREILRLRDRERAVFLEEIAPVLSRVVRQKGGLLVIERSTVFLAADSIDITDDVIAAIDEVIGDGGRVDPEEP